MSNSSITTHPRFISFEGPDGGGKTGQVEKLKGHIENLYGPNSVVTSKDPGGTLETEKIRERVKYDKNLSPEEANELLFLARWYDLEFKILPALTKGKWVISDRFIDGSFTYQFLQGVPEKTIQEMMFEYSPHKPALTFLLDVDPGIGLQRKKGQDFCEPSDVFESQNMEFHFKVKKRFLDLADQDPERFKVITTTTKTPLEVATEVKNVFDIYLTRMERDDGLSSRDEFPDRSR